MDLRAGASFGDGVLDDGGEGEALLGGGGEEVAAEVADAGVGEVAGCGFGFGFCFGFGDRGRGN